MPDGSSSAQPVMGPGPSGLKKRLMGLRSWAASMGRGIFFSSSSAHLANVLPGSHDPSVPRDNADGAIRLQDRELHLAD